MGSEAGESTRDGTGRSELEMSDGGGMLIWNGDSTSGAGGAVGSWTRGWPLR